MNMMAKKVDVEVVYREFIKPSDPTPPHLRRYQLSLLDQIAPREYMSPVLFYDTDNTNNVDGTKLSSDTISACLKASLSEALSRYYPLAGRLNDNLIVECNDEGVPYMETKVGCALSDVLHTMDPDDDSLLGEFLPFLIDAHHSMLLGIQFNVFKCGGIALGFCLSHKIADGVSLAVFMKIWAEICRGGGENIPRLEFIGAKLFPPKEAYNNDTVGVRPAVIYENVIKKKFVFGPRAIEALRKNARENLAGNEHGRLPSRVEAVEAFILSRFAASANKANGQPSRGRIGGYVMFQAVNLRTIVDPQLPEHSFGNLVGQAMAYLPHGDTTNTAAGGICNDLIPRFRGAINTLATENMANNQIYLLQVLARNSREDPIPFGFSSVCGIRFSGFNFGWGEPALTGAAARPVRNAASLSDTNLQDGGVVARISLEKEDMSNFEKDEEIRFFVRLDDNMSRL